MKKKYLFSFILLMGIAAFTFADAENATKRFGLFIGANNGGRGRTQLRYAVSDARSVARVFSEMGGISSEDNMLLIEPNIGQIEAQINALQQKVLQEKNLAIRGIIQRVGLRKRRPCSRNQLCTSAGSIRIMHSNHRASVN